MGLITLKITSTPRIFFFVDFAVNSISFFLVFFSKQENNKSDRFAYVTKF